jgi:hypothetical protein
VPFVKIPVRASVEFLFTFPGMKIESLAFVSADKPGFFADLYIDRFVAYRIFYLFIHEVASLKKTIFSKCNTRTVWYLI